MATEKLLQATPHNQLIKSEKNVTSQSNVQEEANLDHYRVLRLSAETCDEQRGEMANDVSPVESAHGLLGCKISMRRVLCSVCAIMFVGLTVYAASEVPGRKADIEDVAVPCDSEPNGNFSTGHGLGISGRNSSVDAVSAPSASQGSGQGPSQGFGDRHAIENISSLHPAGVGVSNLAFVEATARMDEHHEELMCEPYEATNKGYSCAGPPYLYLTFHGGKSKSIRNVCKYSRDGCSLGPVLHRDGALAPLHTELRGIAVVDDGNLVVADAYKENSKIFRYSNCLDRINNKREKLAILTEYDSHGNPGLVHPYSVVVSGDFLFVSSQGTSELLRYNLTTGEAANLPHKFQTSHSNARNYPALFFRIPRSHHHPDGLRGLATDGLGTIFAADKWKGIFILNRNGEVMDIISHVPKPISVWYSLERKSIFVGCSRTHIVYEISVEREKKVKQILKSKDLQHPAGIAGFGDDLFVVSQRKRCILRFSISSGKYKAKMIEGLKDDGERLVLSPC